MKIKFNKILKYLLIFIPGIFLLLVCIPRSYQVPKMEKNAAMQFWNLPTGSKIGYVHIPAKGPRKSSPIIFLNGGPGGYITDQGIQLRSALSALGYDVYMYDQIGSGQSNRLAHISEYTADRHKKDLEAIIDQIGADQVILIGQSWGAVLAVLYAADHPSKIEKMIFTCPGPIFPVRSELMAVKPPDHLNLESPVFKNADGNRKANNLRTKAMALFATTFGVKLASDAEADDFETYLNFEVNKSTVSDTAKIQKMSAGGGFYARVMTFNSLLTMQDPRPKLKGSEIPILVMKAQYDNQKWGFTQEYCEIFQHHTFIVIPDAGHAIALEQPELYLKTIAEYLK
jgi:proline iminopeptidase